jgi:hypothetical protein
VRGSGHLRAQVTRDAYLHYLLSTYLPLALERDLTLGLSAGSVANALRRRLERTTDPQARRLCERAIHDLEEVPRG